MTGTRIAVIAVLALTTTACALDAPDRHADARRNAALLADAPPFPRSTRHTVESYRETSGELGASDDHYTSARVDVLPRGVPLRRVEAWYRTHLEQHGWRVRTFWEERVAGNPPPGVQSIGRRGKALVQIVIDPEPPEARVVADYLGNRLCHSRTESGCW
jgi:hypothetical protein